MVVQFVYINIFYINGGIVFPNRKLFTFSFAVLIILSTLFYHPTQASAIVEFTFIVDNTMDMPDFAIGNSVCSAGQPTGGPCTLRAAISEANANLSDGPVTILVPPGVYTLVIPPSSPDHNSHGDLNINATNSANLIIIQPTQPDGVVLISTSPSFNDRILSVGWGAHVIMRGINFSGSHLVLDVTNQTGGGAILNDGSLILEETGFVANSVTCAQGANCTSNLNGGAILNYGDLIVSDTTFVNNSADRGYAIFNAGGAPNCQINHSLFTQNTGGSGTITNYSTMTIVNSTLSGNFSSSSWFAGVINDGVGVMRMQSCTIANEGAASSIVSSGTVHVSDSIFLAQPEKGNFSNSGGTWNSGGYNIFSDDGGPVPTTTGDLINTDPMLEGLGNYGGPTMTHGLQMNSPAINHRSGNCATALYIIEDDQRHQPRSDGRCDSGAFELGRFYLPVIIK